MNVLVIGGSGAIGRPLVGLLCEADHHTVVMSRHASSKRESLDSRARLVDADVLDPRALSRVLDEVAPDAVIHQATAIPDPVNPRKVAKSMEPTTTLRRVGTRNIVEALRDRRETRLISQSIAFAYAPQGPRALPETAPLNLSAPVDFRPVVEGVAALEELTLAANGVVLRYANLYGPGTTYGPGGATAERVRKRSMPIVGSGGGVFSFVHVDDAAAATAAALELEGPAVLNIADDDPAPVSEWLPALAQALGANPPRRAPVWLTRLLLSGWAVEYMTRVRGAHNAQAKERLGWQPERSSWRQGFVEMAAG
jgi:nucleoside-diphosphate-sugar epimerase